MTAPFAPELISPKNKGAAPSGAVPLTWKMRSVTAGDAMTTYAIRRRIMTPTVGAYEWWNGTTWVGSETFLTGPVAPNAVKDGMTYSVTMGSWTTDRVYQWSVKTRNAAVEASPYSDDLLVQVHNLPYMAVSFSSAVVSRPSISWVWYGSAGFYQKTYRFAVYANSIPGMAGFDPALPYWQAQAVWIMPARKYSATDWKVTIDADLVSGTTYLAYYETSDNSDLFSSSAGSTWVSNGSVTPSFTAVPAPTLVATPDVVNGVMGLVVRSSFNLLADNSSIFTGGIDNWIGSLNCQTQWNSSLAKLECVCGGMSYAAMDVAYTTFAAGDTAFANFNAEKVAQAAPTGTARVLSGDQTGERIAVSPSIAYSAILTANNQTGATRTGKIGIRWYKADNTASAITVLSQGSAVTLTPGTDVNVAVQNVTSPADAAFAVLEFEWTTAAVGDVIRIDDVAFASTSSISWSPSGTSMDITFVLERSLDAITWVPVWGMSKLAPKASDSPAVSQVTINDRAVPLGTELIYYRAYAISKFSTSPVWSLLASATVAGMNPNKWFLRRTSRTDMDSRVIVGQISFDTQLHREVVEPEGQLNAIVNFNTMPDTETASVTLMSLDKLSFETIMAALKADETLYLQTNLDGYGYYVRVVDAIRRNQRRSPASSGGVATMRNVFDISFSAVVVKDFY